MVRMGADILLLWFTAGLQKTGGLLFQASVASLWNWKETGTLKLFVI